MSNTSETTAQRIQRFINEDTAAAQAATAAGRHCDAAVLWATVSNLQARLTWA